MPSIDMKMPEVPQLLGKKIKVVKPHFNLWSTEEVNGALHYLYSTNPSRRTPPGDPSKAAVREVTTSACSSIHLFL
jgi:hypothetical protein